VKNSLYLVGLIVFSLGLAACGGGGSSNKIGGVMNKIDVVMTDFQYSPDAFTVPAGQDITVNVTNNGAVVHEFVIMKHGMDVTKDFTNEDRKNMYWRIEVQAGDHTSARFTAPSEPGKYQIICGTPGHFIAGMVGKLTVVAP
jgi:uncharacterized cupredoxin-like copper-binding protein